MIDFMTDEITSSITTDLQSGFRIFYFCFIIFNLMTALLERERKNERNLRQDFILKNKKLIYSYC